MSEGVGQGGGSGRRSWVPEAAFAVALATIDGVGPRTLFRLLELEGPSAVWARIVRGEIRGGGEDRTERGSEPWQTQAARTDVQMVWELHRRHGIGVLWIGGQGYPDELAADPDAPGVLFHLGDPSALAPRPRVALVGTRSATRYGLGVAAQLGADLASAGVSVVSGLALGIDGAAHEGAVAGQQAAEARGGPPVAVVAGGLDRPYPARHANLWRRVEEAGVVLSTSPARTPVDRGRFPQRNRLIAALAHVVVVVESHQAGGSLYTAREAEGRGRLVGVVPGSIRSPASAGTNDLLADGCFPVRDVSDVQAALGLMLSSGPTFSGLLPAVPTQVGVAEAARAANAPDAGRVGVRRKVKSGAIPRAAAGVAAAGDADPASAAGSGRGAGQKPGHTEGPAQQVLTAIGHDRCSIDQLLRRTGLELPELCTVLEELRGEGRLVEEGGWWEHR